MSTEPRTYRLERISDLLDLDDRQFEAALAELPAALRAVRHTRAMLREVARAMGAPDPCPDAAQALPALVWVDDGARDLTINIRTAEPAA
jgi:hypothetical protein